MNDLKDLLALALTDAVPAGSEPADPAADLARGRALLRRRRAMQLSGATGALLVLGLVPLAAGMTTSGRSPAASIGSGPGIAVSSPRTGGTGSAPADHVAMVDLVHYNGKQPPGYQVGMVPKGWEIQGVDAWALVIAPKDFPDQSLQSFQGKLVVMLQSKDAEVPGPGTSLPVNGRTGRFHLSGDDTQMLVFQTADQHWVVVQAPLSLGWTQAKLAAFAAGVKVLSTAQAGVG